MAACQLTDVLALDRSAERDWRCRWRDYSALKRKGWFGAASQPGSEWPGCCFAAPSSKQAEYIKTRAFDESALCGFGCCFRYLSKFGSGLKKGHSISLAVVDKLSDCAGCMEQKRVKIGIYSQGTGGEAIFQRGPRAGSRAGRSVNESANIPIRRN